MTTLSATFPGSIEVQEGEQFSIEARARNGELLVTRVVRHGVRPDKKQAVATFLRRWSGAGQPLTDETVDADRTARLRAKHVK